MKKVQQGFTLIELMIVVAIIGILAAVAIPAYGDYTARAQAAEAFTLLDGLKTPYAENFSADGSWPVTIAGTATSGKYVASVAGASGVVATSGGSLTATFRTTNIAGKVNGKTVTLTYDSTANPQWTCTSNLPAEIKPKSC